MKEILLILSMYPQPPWPHAMAIEVNDRTCVITEILPLASTDHEASLIMNMVCMRDNPKQKEIDEVNF